MSFLLRVLVALVILTIFEFYFFRKLTKVFKYFYPGYNSKKYKTILTVIIIYLNLYPLLLLLNQLLGAILDSSGPLTMQGPFYDYFLIYPFWAAIIILLQAAVFFVLFEVVKLFIKAFIRKREIVLRIETVTIAFIIAFVILYVPGRMIYDNKSVSFREVVIYRNNLNKDLEDFRLVFISDLQADKFTNGNRLQRYIDVVNNAQPDLILAAGDFITSGPFYIDSAAAYAGKMKAELGIYSCIGDHDHWAYREDMKRSLREISAALLAKNIHLVHNKNITFKYKSAEILVTFVTNSYVDAINVDSLLDLTETEGRNDLKIFLSHQPKHQSIETAADSGYDLFLAGHTHGGQITFLFPFMNLSPTLFETKFVRGNFIIGDMTLIVSRGLGMSLAPIRYNSTPEVILIRFKSK